MFDLNTTLIVVSLLLVFVVLGVDVAVALGVTAFAGLFLVFGEVKVVLSYLGSTANQSLNDQVFAIVPLFILMGEFIARSGAAGDIYAAINRNLSRLPGRLAHATVLGNTVFSFVTGTSLASATTFTRIAYPEMKRFGYHRGFSLGVIAGSASLGLLIPPSIFMVIWGILTEQSIGSLFIAGIIPGFLLAAMMMLYISTVALIAPARVGIGHTEIKDTPAAPSTSDNGSETAGIVPPDDRIKSSVAISIIGIVAIICGSLGGIWMGFFTPTEGAGIGALMGLVLGLAKGMRWPQIQTTVLAVGRSSVPIMVLIFAAQLYSRMLALTGVGSAIADSLVGTGFGPIGTLAIMVGIWFVMGMLIDSVSIMLLTVPIFAPASVLLGFDPIAFALIGILAIEAGVLTPPFGLLVYAVKAVVPDDDVTLGHIFRGSIVFWGMLLGLSTAIAFLPDIATFLPGIIER